MNEKKADREAIAVSVARQPVFDQKGRLWGYELFCVGGTETSRPGFESQPNTAITVESSAYVSLQQILQGEKKIIVDFSEKSILDKLPYALPPVLAVIKVGEQAGQEPTVVEMLHRLKADGYLLAIRGFTGNEQCESLYPLADILAIEADRKGRDALAADFSTAQKYNALLLATRVQDRKMFEVCRELGFSLFRGSFFKSPDKMTVRKLSSNEVLRLRLLRLIEVEEPDLAEMARTIQSDATISYRLLAYLNSAAFAFTRKIKSIQQAITLLGWDKVKNWLQVLLLTDVSQSKNAKELVLLSAQRGMLLERIARDHDFWGFEPESVHLLGLFSLLDALLEVPMTEVVAYLPIENKMKSALCREANNEYVPLLNLAQCLEEALWGEAETMIQQLNLDRKKILAGFQDSVRWVSELATLDM